jgi:hypothetical protein
VGFWVYQKELLFQVAGSAGQQYCIITVYFIIQISPDENISLEYL